MPVRYTLATNPEADNQLARLWTQANAADRKAITRAAHQIDKELLEDADQKGTALTAVSPTLRRIQVSPLRAYFHAIEPDRIARIIDYELIS